MKKNYSIQSISLFALTFYISCVHASLSTEMISESRDYAVGESIGDWRVIEYKDAVASNRNNVWTISGISGGAMDANDSTVMWFFYPGSYATVEFAQPSTSVAFMLQSDANDGLVNFYVDDTEVFHHFDMQTLPGILPGESGVETGTFVVSGLDNVPHTVKIESAPDFSFADGRNDFHMYGAAAVSPVPAPAPIWLWLACSGLLGIIRMRRKFMKAA
jgi:hypothetical protein